MVPLVGPLGVVGVEMVSGRKILTERPGDQLDTTEVSWVHLARAFTLYVPAEAQDLEALVWPTGSQPELVPSPQSKKYWTS